MWSEAREQSLLCDTIQTSEFSSEKILALPVTKIDAEAQTDIVIIQEEDLNENFIPGDSQISPTSPRDLNESVIGKLDLDLVNLIYVLFSKIQKKI